LYKKFNTVIGNKEDIMHESLESRLIRLLINKNSKIIYATHNKLAFEVDFSCEIVSKRGYIKLQRGKIVILKDLDEILKV
jgi:CRP/FNR family transcriptional regulator